MQARAAPFREGKDVTEHYQPSAGDQARPLPPYRPAGPQAGPAPLPLQTMFSPIPSQSTGAPAPAPLPAPAPAPQAAPSSVAAARDQFGARPSFQPGGTAAHPTYTPADGASGAVPAQGSVAPSASGSYVPGGAPTPASFTPGAPTTFTPAPTSVLPTAPATTFTPTPSHASGPASPAPAAPSGAPGAPAEQRKTRERPTTSRVGMAQSAEEGDLPIDEVLARMVELGASDVHLTTGATPMVRISGSLKQLDGFGQMSPEPLRRTIYSILTQKQRETFEANLELDFSYAVRGLARFRVNIYQQRESIGAAFRVIPYEIKPLEDLGVPAVVGNFAGLPRGLVLVTGPTGSGKSTTLASIIDLANRTREDHIMTVEDPIEFLHRHKKSLVNQREVGADTLSFANALKHVLRQDPDIILVGEMRDLETISVALTAAETGHLVFATLHTQDAAQTIDRVIDVFPSHQQSQVRTQLAGAIQGVVCQTLCKRADGPGRAVATEVLVATPAVRNLIREGKTHQIYSSMQAGASQGMHTMDQHLSELVKKGTISYEVGLEKCHHVEDFNRLVGRFSGGTQGGAALADAQFGGL